jgi:hypothetical protein
MRGIMDEHTVQGLNQGHDGFYFHWPDDLTLPSSLSVVTNRIARNVRLRLSVGKEALRISNGPRASTGLPHRSCLGGEGAICAHSSNGNPQISHGLGEFVLQIRTFNLPVRLSLSVNANLSPLAPPAVKYTSLFALWHIARVHLFRYGREAGRRALMVSN